MEEGDRAAKDARWLDVGTADLSFHQGLVALARSVRIDELMRGIFAELRLVFHKMSDPRQFHEPYLARNRAILDLLDQGDFVSAASTLETYLDDAERQLLDAYGQYQDRQADATA